MQVQNKDGFTLIEILIVLTIVSIISAVAVVSFGDFGAKRKTIEAAEYFVSYLELLQEQAILESNAFGIKIEKNGYETYRLQSGSHWEIMPKNHFFHWQSFPSNVLVILQSPIQHHNKQPDIMINASGDITAFQMQFGTSTEPNVIHLQGKNNGSIMLQH